MDYQANRSVGVGECENATAKVLLCELPFRLDVVYYGFGVGMGEKMQNMACPEDVVCRKCLSCR